MTGLVGLRPLEAVLFRDARSFDADGQGVARSMHPEPATIFGAVRTAALRVACEDVDAYSRGKRCAQCGGSESCRAVQLAGPPGSQGAPDHGGELRLLGTCLTTDHGDAETRLWFPAPGHLTPSRSGLGAGLRGPRPVAGRWDLPLPEAPAVIAEDADAQLPAWVDPVELSALLSGRLPSGLGSEPWSLADTETIPAEHRLVVRDDRVGLARRDGTAMEGYLYRAQFSRYRVGISLAAIVDYATADGAAQPSYDRTVGLGGKGRAATVESRRLGHWPPEALAGPRAQAGRFCVAIMTPAYFGDGWRPSLPRGARLASAVVPPAVTGKGWDLARRRSRPARWLCPAGSVWWIDADDDDAAAEIVGWHGRPICEDRPHAGYGLAFVSEWEEPNAT